MGNSNAILARVVPGGEGYISLGIAVLNVIMTFPAIYLVEVSNVTSVNDIHALTLVSGSVLGVGNCWYASQGIQLMTMFTLLFRPFQMVSMLGVQVMLIALAIGLNKGDVRISSVAILAFVG